MKVERATVQVVAILLIILFVPGVFAQSDEPSEETPDTQNQLTQSGAIYESIIQESEDPTYQLVEVRWAKPLSTRAKYFDDAWFAEYAYVGRHIAIDVVYFQQKFLGEQYRELDIGAGYPFHFNGGFTAFGVYYAASRGPDYQWLAPAFNGVFEKNRVSARILVLYYIGLTDDSPDLYFVDPMRLGFKPVDWLTFGVSGKFTRYVGEDWQADLGPMLQVTTKVGRFEVRHFTGEELQVSYTIAW